MFSRPLHAAVALMFVAATVAPLVASAGATLPVYVVAPSVSTDAEAEAILQNGGWQRVPAAQAASVLVVVRSEQVLPLSSSYDSLQALEEDAHRQPNLTGPRFHVYVFGRHAEIALKQVKHVSYDAE